MAVRRRTDDGRIAYWVDMPRYRGRLENKNMGGVVSSYMGAHFWFASVSRRGGRRTCRRCQCYPGK